MTRISRRGFLQSAAGAAALPLMIRSGWADEKPARPQALQEMQLGLVTYNWGRDWDLPTVIKNCEAAGFAGVELRSTHKHGVEITLNTAQREEVAKRFADSAVDIVGLGSACEYHSPDPATLKKNLEETKAFVRLCHDIGGSGVKVRPNGLPQDVPVRKTVEQIGRSLKEMGEYAAGYGVKIRLEVHGRGTSSIPHIKSIMDIADNENVVVCWNCNREDLAGEGLAANYELLKDRIGTIHIHDLTRNTYPWQTLFGLLKKHRFRGWTLLEEGQTPKDIVAAMKANRQAWLELVKTA